MWGSMSTKSARLESLMTADLAINVKQKLDRPLVLVGLMGAGKSRLARMLAKTLDLPFYDCDAELEQSAGRSVTEIVSQIGEPAFHQANENDTGTG